MTRRASAEPRNHPGRGSLRRGRATFERSSIAARSHLNHRDAAVVIIGAGMAAARLAQELPDCVVLGDEPHPPYNRILLSAVLEGTHAPESLPLPTGDADVRLGTRVVEIHREEREVELADRSRVPYDRLVLATGSIPTLPPIRGLVRIDGRLDGRVHAFRTLDDCHRLDAAAAAHARTAVVVGGGLLGLQVARALSIRGLATEVVEGGDHLLRSQVDAKAGAILARDLKRLGTTVYTGARAVRLTDAGLVLDNGFTLDTDLVVLTAGGRPSTALARRAGLEVRRGIVVDHLLRTERPAHPRDRRLRPARRPGHRLRAARLGAGRAARPAPRRRGRRVRRRAHRRPAARDRPRRRRARRPGAHRRRGRRGLEPGHRQPPQARRPRRRDRRRHPGRRPVPDRADHPALRPRHRPRPARARRPADGGARRRSRRPARRRRGLRLRRRQRRPGPGLRLARRGPRDHPRHHRLRRLHLSRPRARHGRSTRHESSPQEEAGRRRPRHGRPPLRAGRDRARPHRDPRRRGDRRGAASGVRPGRADLVLRGRRRRAVAAARGAVRRPAGHPPPRHAPSPRSPPGSGSSRSPTARTCTTTSWCSRPAPRRSCRRCRATT